MKELNKTKSFILALLIIMGLVFLNLPSVSSKVKNLFYSISYPISKQVNNITNQIKNSWEFLESLKQIREQNIQLEKNIRKLKAENVKLEEVKKENVLLRSYLDLPADKIYTIELANVINYDFQGLEKFILIDKGQSSEIQEGAFVIISNNVLVGKIVETFDNFSKVLLITSPNSKIPALIQKSRVKGLIKGTKEKKLLLDLVSKDIEVEKGQIVVSSGIEENLPKGFFIGEISFVQKEENKIFQYVEVTPAVNLEKLEQVFIIKN